MLECKAVKAIVQGNRTVGYTLMDKSGKTMDASYESIVNAITSGAAVVKNLVFNSDNQLVMISDKVEKPSNSNAQTSATGNSTESPKMVRMKQLVKTLNHARYVYEQGTDEIMSNKEYDELYDELAQLEKETGVTLNNSPTINIGYEVVSKLKKVEHKYQMGSLAKTKSVDDVVRFTADKDVLLSWKMDGLTVVTTYNNGNLVSAVTRGNGFIGEDVTHNAIHFKNLPLKIPCKDEVTVRGEANITYTDFNRINQTLPDGEKYKNPRNLASGSVRALDSAVSASRCVKFTAFALVDAEKHGCTTEEQSFDWMKSMGFDVVQHVKANSSNIRVALDKFENAVKNKKIDFPVDGLVIKYNDIAYGKSLGMTAKTPRHSIALKWADEVAVTRILDIDWSVGKSGVITPVAVFQPVELEGSVIERASVHNLSILGELMLGYGDEVEVYKANMIIPQISRNLTRSGNCEIPLTCPVCGECTEIKEDDNSGVLTLHCTNPFCEAKGSRLLKHFVSRDAMNIDGISDKTLGVLVDFDIVDTFASVFRIKNHPEIMEIEGFGRVSFMNMVNAVEKARNVHLYNLIYALSIPNVGLETAKTICKYFGYDLKRTVTATYYDLININGIGDTVATNFSDYFRDKENFENFKDLVSELHIIQDTVQQIDANDPINGKTFCITGALNIFPGKRDQAKAIIESRGGKLTGSVSRSTDFLITNDTTSGSRKNVAAQQYGIPILTEQQFIETFRITF